MARRARKAPSWQLIQGTARWTALRLLTLDQKILIATAVAMLATQRLSDARLIHGERPDLAARAIGLDFGAQSPIRRVRRVRTAVLGIRVDTCDFDRRLRHAFIVPAGDGPNLDDIANRKGSP